jgi:hypothetical protein
VRMPASIVARWLTLGVALIVILLAVAALLPRPVPEYSLLDFGSVESQRRDPQQGTGSGEEGAKGNSGSQSSSDQSGSSGQSSGSSSGNGGNRPGGSAGSGKGGQGKSGGSSAPQSAPARSPTNWLTNLGVFGVVLKWVVLIIAGLLIAFIVLRSLLQFLAGFTDWASRLLQSLQSWWNRIFGWWDRAKPTHETTPLATFRAPRPFAVFANPFLNGQAHGMTPEEVVRYTFEAVEAWAAGRALNRRPEETPLEFAARIGEELPAFVDQLDQLTTLYARMAYGGVRLPNAVLPALQQLWEQLDALEQRPVAV